MKKPNEDEEERAANKLYVIKEDITVYSDQEDEIKQAEHHKRVVANVDLYFID